MTGLDAHVIVRRGDFSVDVSLAVVAGETAALLGPNAAGKSTTASAIAGLIPLDDGHVALGERSLDRPTDGVFVPPDRRRVGVVFQEHLLFPHLTVAENVAFGVRDGRERATVAREWLERVGMDGLGDRRVQEISGGQAQRVALARTLAAEPEVLLLDEPLAALDVRTRIEMRRLLSSHLREFDGPRLLITHDPVEAFGLADQVHVMETGRITQTGTPEEVRARPRTQYAADLSGTNLLRGVASQGRVEVSGQTLHVADQSVTGTVVVVVRPSSVSVHTERPTGSPRNVWFTTVTAIESGADRIRLRLGAPLPLDVDITQQASTALELQEGAEVWVSVKAMEIEVVPT